MKSTSTDAKVVTAFGRFAASGYKRALFTKELYQALSRAFGFIAHFDRDGFYNARFGDPEARVETLAIIVEEEPQTLNHVEQMLRTMVTARGLLDAAKKELAAETETRERAELVRLKAKYEPNQETP